MKFLLLSLLVLSMSAFAAESTSKMANPGTLDVDPKGKTEEMADKTATITDEHDVIAHVTCKVKEGVELKKGDKGFDACLKKVKKGKKNSKDPKAKVNVKFEK